MENAKILLVADDVAWLSETEEILHKTGYRIIHKASSIANAKCMIRAGQPHLLICSVWVNGENVLENLESELSTHRSIIISERNGKESFLKTQSLPNSTYLVKPFHEYTLLSAIHLLLDKALPDSPRDEPFFLLRDAKQHIIKMPFKEILWIKAEGNYTMIHTQDARTHALKKSLVKLLSELDGRFVRVHKSYAVNTDHLSRVDFSHKQLFVGETAIPVGREYRSALENS